TNENLSTLSHIAQTRGEICRRANGGIIHSAFKANHPERCISLSNTHSEIQLMPTFSPSLREAIHLLPHDQGHAHGPHSVVRTRQWIVEKDHEAIPRKALQGALKAKDHIAQHHIILPQDAHHLLRFGSLREGRKASQVAEDYGDLSAMAVQELLAS